jgi:hypothetical protein
MLSSLLASLTSLRDFFSRAFFTAAFLPTLLFSFINSLILFVWSWAFHNWVRSELLDTTGAGKTVVFTALFLALWIISYVVAALTPLAIRTLEGRNWWLWLRDPGIQFHLARYEKLSNSIDDAVEIYARIDNHRLTWRQRLEEAGVASARGLSGVAPPSPDSQSRIAELTKLQTADRLIPLKQLDTLVTTYESEIRATGITDELRGLAPRLQLLVDYAYNRALSEHSRLLNERNMEFGDREDIAPTRFGNVGQSSQAYAMRAYNCNLIRIWSALRRAAEKDDSTSKALENCKSQLDFLVACYWVSLGLAIEWAMIFTWYGEWRGAIASALFGPLICWMFWYGAAVEQYRVLQDLIVSTLNALRFQVLSDFRYGLPADLPEERELWRAIDFAISNGELLNLRYQYPKT